MALLIVVAEHTLKANIESKLSVRDFIHTILCIGSQNLTFYSKLPSPAAAPSSRAAMSS